ncbi:MAG: M2 family metallopeptidase, partial [Anaerolineae bacterium]|nr:M2 family metallopeptidase [Anaerolineae bacterium]
MISEASAFVANRAAAFRELFIAHSHAEWECATTGSDKALERRANLQRQIMEFEADRIAFAQLREWDNSGSAQGDPLLARQVRLMRLTAEKEQMDTETIAQIVELDRQATEAFTNFRGQLDGREVSNNEIEQILLHESDSGVRRAAWLASKEIGTRVADTLRQLARLRNQGARRIGYRHYHHMALTLAEIDDTELFALLDRLYHLTIEPFGRAKAQLDRKLAERFGVEAGDLQPWHYADPFFQNAPQTGEAT